MDSAESEWLNSVLSPKIAWENTSPCQGWSPLLCREAGVGSKVWPGADLKIMHGKSNKPLFCPSPVLLCSSAPLPSTKS